MTTRLIHHALAAGAEQLNAAARSAERAGHLDEVARIALPVIGKGLHLALVDMTLHLFDLELAER